MKPRGEPLHLVDNAGAVLVEGRDITVFYGPRISVLREGKNAPAVDLGQKWDVLSAIRDPRREAAWIFGWNEGKIVARRRDPSGWAPETAIAASGIVDRFSSCLDGDGGGPIIAWREQGSSRIRCAFYDGTGFSSRPEFDIGEAEYWDVAAARGRILLA